MIAKHSIVPKRHKKFRTDNQKAPDVGLELTRAIKWHREGRLQKAREIYRKILKWHPGHADTLHLLGFVEHQTDNGKVAVGLISKAIEIQPESPLYHHNLGLATTKPIIIWEPFFRTRIN
jgi:tetratricopeptide (TPR) repeat protein